MGSLCTAAKCHPTGPASPCVAWNVPARTRVHRACSDQRNAAFAIQQLQTARHRSPIKKMAMPFQWVPYTKGWFHIDLLVIRARKWRFRCAAIDPARTLASSAPLTKTTHPFQRPSTQRVINSPKASEAFRTAVIPGRPPRSTQSY